MMPTSLNLMAVGATATFHGRGCNGRGCQATFQCGLPRLVADRSLAQTKLFDHPNGIVQLCSKVARHHVTYTPVAPSSLPTGVRSLIHK